MTLDKNEIAALLEALCERPFAGDQDGHPLDAQAIASRAARALSHTDAEQPGAIAGQAEAGQAEAGRAESPGREAAALASILSGTATGAQCHAFQEAAVASGAVRLEAQSALAFVDGIEQTPLKAPAHLVEDRLSKKKVCELTLLIIINNKTNNNLLKKVKIIFNIINKSKIK